jgi:hypothetical protein
MTHVGCVREAHGTGFLGCQHPISLAHAEDFEGRTLRGL